MKAMRRLFQASLCAALLIAALSPVSLTAQKPAESAPPQPPAAKPQPSRIAGAGEDAGGSGLPATSPQEPQAQQSYSLSPDKLAKAIAVSRIRNILNIVGSLWGLAVLWLLLSTRGCRRP